MMSYLKRVLKIDLAMDRGKRESITIATAVVWSLFYPIVYNKQVWLADMWYVVTYMLLSIFAYEKRRSGDWWVLVFWCFFVRMVYNFFIMIKVVEYNEGESAYGVPIVILIILMAKKWLK